MANLDAAFSALSDPTRRAILARLALGEATVMQLAEPFEMTQPAISKHLKVLETAGLIVRRVEGAKHPCRLANDGMEAMDRWLEMLRTALARNYDRLDAVLAAMPKKAMPEKTMPKKGKKTR
ncbi:MAG TPA: metalloregulator ArsR/SmtB family transcription factor [Bryobacteraceae bacterium]|jgi:DNA-binding transcriptional ArsR family regulator